MSNQTIHPEAGVSRSRDDAGSDGVYADEIIALLARLRRRMSDLRDSPYVPDPDCTGMTIEQKRDAWSKVYSDRNRTRRELEFCAHLADKIRLLINDEMFLVLGKSSHMVGYND